MEGEEECRPIPAPRRVYPELTKSEYENVTIELINKNLNINVENIHTTNCTDKLSNNKVMIGTFCDEPNRSCASDTNDLYGPNANEQVPADIYSTPKPAPRPRKAQNSESDSCRSEIYENTVLRNIVANEDSMKKELPSGSKALRKAPELPPKTYLSNERSTEQVRERCNTQRHSISSEFSTTSSCHVTIDDNGNLNENTFMHNKKQKSASNATLNSSIAESTDGSESGNKYKLPSPGYVDALSSDDDEYSSTECNNGTQVNVNDLSRASISKLESNIDSNHDSVCNQSVDNDLLKSLGTTSKLLTESLGERMACKARDAKYKLDKNLKTSTEVLSNLSTETGQRLRTVGKRIGNNFTLTKKDKETEREAVPTFYEAGRPQTLPPNDKVFDSISFSSPLHKKTGGVTDLTHADDNNSYEVPRNNQVVQSDQNLSAPPSYEEVLKQSPNSTFYRNTPASKSLMVPKHVAEAAASVALSKQRSNTNMNCVNEEFAAGNMSDRSRDSIVSMPMPSYPPPTLPQPTVDSESDAIYGKLNAIQAPVRQKRRKNYEQIQLRRAPSPLSVVSIRANVDSAELHKLNVEAQAQEREESFILRETIRAAEELTPKPDRSESWEYFEDGKEDSDSSSSEPIYANHEATYGRMFEMATSSKDLLPPRNQFDDIGVEEMGAVGGAISQPPPEVIKEFDPLISAKASTLCRSDKSNQLLLLEHLLEEDTYGALKEDEVPAKSDDDISMCTSEEDNGNVSAISNTSTSQLATPPSPPPGRTVVLPSPSLSAATTNAPASPNKEIQIVHQNARLRSDSMEDILEASEDRIKPFLSRVEESPSSTSTADLTRPTANRSNWFANEAPKESAQQQRANPFNKLNIDDGESPPSYLEAIGVDDKSSAAAAAGGEQKSRTARFMNSMKNVKIRVDALKRKTSFKNSQKSDVRVALQMIPRPSLSPLLVRYEGHLIRFPTGVVEDILKEMQNRKVILRDRQFQTYLDSEMKTPKEVIPLEHITTLQCLSNIRVTDHSTFFYCFEVTTATPKMSGNNSSSSSSPSAMQLMCNPNLVITNGTSGNCKHQRVLHLYGVSKESERGVWMQKLLESLTNAFPPKYTCHYYRAGWCYLKNSITSEWSGTWLVLKKSQRRLAYVSDASMNVEKMDLRKARCIVLKESDETIQNLYVESGPTLMIDCPPFTVYMIMSSSRETKIWRHIIREVAHNNGFSLAEQQLTKFNVPVIVDKCINFVYIHGSMSEGIYRKSGSENSILKLLSAFRTDAFNVEITRNEYNEHDVANALKRFMRDLPERLLGKLSESFICVTELEEPSEKIQIYKELLVRLNVIERETLKKIVGHLAFISSQRGKNKMSIQNLTMIWGPTLLKSQAEEMVYSQKESDVLTDLITFYKNLFPLSQDEIKKEQEMLICLQKYYASAETLTDSVKKSGDLKMWITLNPNPDNTAEEKEQVNATITPTKTAYELCRELAIKMKLASHEIALHEIILNGTLERPLHHDTKVFDVVLNWSYWPEADRKNNYLAVKPIDILREVQRAVKNLATVTPSKELRFADNRTKSFKTYLCELRDGKIVISKKEKNDKTVIVREIFLHGTTAYLGCEKKRDFPWSWAITFVEKTQSQILRSRDSPFIGHVLAGSEWMDRTIWYSSIWYCLYGESILPPVEIIIK